jgi:hypothetical protein
LRAGDLAWRKFLLTVAGQHRSFTGFAFKLDSTLSAIHLESILAVSNHTVKLFGILSKKLDGEPKAHPPPPSLREGEKLTN